MASFQPVGKFPNLYSLGKGRRIQYFTKSKHKRPFFEEKVFRRGKEAFREVDPSRSKLFASIAKNISQLGIKDDSSVLYLGASHGYTVSFLSDMLTDGCIFALDFAPRVVRDLVFVSERLKNVAPIMADANQPRLYIDDVPQVDIVFMDIAQKDQTGIFLKNCESFLKQGGFGILALKARSYDVTKKPKTVFAEVRQVLEKHHPVVDYRELAPFEQDHALFVIKKK